MFHSQFEEDRILADMHRRLGGDALCIEVGANDGVADSMTYHFEQQGWQCILVEPNPDLCERIRVVRTSALFECAASAGEGRAMLHIAEGAERAHSVSSLDTDGHALERVARHGFSGRPIEVRTRRLDDILAEAGVTAMPFFVSIDVEGHEIEVLNGFSIERWRPTILIAEDNSQFADATVRNHLAARGYFPFRRTGVNDWYASRTDDDLASPNNRRQWRATARRERLKAGLRRVPGLVSLVRSLRSR